MQYAFREASGTWKAIFGLTTTNEGYLEVRKDIHVCFVGFEKAFVKNKTRRFNLNVMKDLNNWQSILASARCIKTGAGNIKVVVIHRGFRRGCVLSPILFNILAEKIARSIEL